MMFFALSAFVVALARAAAAPSLDTDSGWDASSQATVAWDLTHTKAAMEPTALRLLVDGTNLYVRFTVVQKETIAATQAVDDVGSGSDDIVAIALWPSGANGFQYTFAANPRGTHYQSSSENTTYAPTWRSVGVPTPTGYRVTMQIPLKAIRGTGKSSWLAQFQRTIHSLNETDVWAYAAGQQYANDVTRAGSLEGFAAKVARASPRLGVYGLAEAGSRRTGGSTSRMGADLALPITPTTSLVATIHPDFSNVETDQQTIAPTAFRRQYTEVRPFFAQGANFYDFSNCFGCPGAQELYTPAIPTPRRGYQLEGKQGPFSFGALDAIGEARSDNAQSVAYTTPNRRFTGNYTRVGSDQPGLHDVTDYGFLSYSDQRRFTAYVEGGAEAGSLVTDGRQSQRYNAGIAFDPKDTFASLSAQRVGSQYNPVDGFVAAGDIAGFSANVNHTWRFTGAIQTVNAGTYYERYAGSDGFGTNLADNSTYLSATFKNKITVAGSVGNGFYRLYGDPVLRAQNQQGGTIGYQFNTALQSQIGYSIGRFGDGRLVNPVEQLSFRLARRATVSLYATDTDWLGDDKMRHIQWLERGSISFDLGPRTSLVTGVRKLIGSAPPFPYPAPYVNATNLSLGFSTRRAHDDFYLVYGDASALVTRPALTFKLVHYFGAEKGT